MKRNLFTFLFAPFLASSLGAAPPADWPEQEAAALAAVDEYFAAFNARDVARFTKSLHYPHMRIDGLGAVKVWSGWEDYAAEVNFDQLIQRTGWARTNLDAKRVIQAGIAKVHVIVAYTRVDQTGKPLVSEESMYVVTVRDGRWAIQMRSSFLEQGPR